MVAELNKSDGSRKASTLALNPNQGYIGICYFSATVLHVAVANLSGEILKSRKAEINISDGPNENLPLSVAWLEEILKQFPKKKLLGIIAGVPGLVDHELGVVVSPPIMQGWDGINISEYYSELFGVPAFLENDVNLLVIAEHQLVYPEVKNLFLVKIGAGIGSGLVIDGKIYRGATGSAGDIDHIQLDALKGSLCRCGHRNCLESFAGGWALVQKIKKLGYEVETQADVNNIARQGDAQVVRLLVQASGYVGHAIADAVNLINPNKIIIVGRLVESNDRIMATIKEVIYQRAAALATRNVDIVTSALGNDRGVLGAAQLGLDKFFYKVGA